MCFFAVVLVFMPMFVFVFSRDGKALERFLEDYFAGHLKRFIKSQPAPERNNGPIKVCTYLEQAECCIHTDVPENHDYTPLEVDYVDCGENGIFEVWDTLDSWGGQYDYFIL